MIIRRIQLNHYIQRKIFRKHRIHKKEIKAIFFDDPYYFKTKNNRYTAIGFTEKYITIIFRYDNKTAEIITAYQSSEWQKKLYKKK